MITFETENSRYQINEDARTYRRTPLDGEQFVSSPRLLYQIDQPLARWFLKRYGDEVFLRLFTPEAVYGIVTTPVQTFFTE